jgi:hypothetical protein
MVSMRHGDLDHSTPACCIVVMLREPEGRPLIQAVARPDLGYGSSVGTAIALKAFMSVSYSRSFD